MKSTKATLRRKFFKGVLRRYAGLCVGWPAGREGRIIFSGDTEEEVERQAASMGVVEVLLFKLPKNKGGKRYGLR